MQPTHHDSKSSSRWVASFLSKTSKLGRSLCARAFRLALTLSLVIGGLLGPVAPMASAAIPREDEAASAAGAFAPARASSPAAPGVSVSKTVLSPAGRNVFYAGETVTFQVAVTNTGTTTVSYLPQHDEYGAECLRFLPKADPPESSEGPGLIQWYDLTFAKGIDLAPGAVFTSTMQFLVVGPAEGQSASGYNTARITNALDANSDPVPTAESTLNFTCSQRPSLTVDKSFVTPQNRTVLLTGETITFKAVVTNTGPTTLGFIPQLDLYDTSCLTFLPKASPPESVGGGGLIQWSDLTVDNGGDLPPGQAFTTTMNFVVTGPASGATHAGTNTVQVDGALDVFGSPAPGAQDTVQYTCAAPASIGDYVWLDKNSNGLQDDGAGAGINGVTVRLYQDNGDGIFDPGTDTLVSTTVTGGDGGYLFTGLFAGTYWVDVDSATVPSGYQLTVGTDPLKVTVNYGDNYLAADFGYGGADVDLVKTDSADPIALGGTLSYRLVVHNAGPSDALNVVVTDTLPAGLTFVVAQPAQTSGPNPYRWDLGTLAVGATRTIIVTTTVSATTGGIITNLAGVTSTTPDPNPNNNQDEESTLLIRPAIDIQKTPDLQQVRVGGTAAFTMTVTNTGDVALTNVTVSDPLAPDCDKTIGALAVGGVYTYTCTRAGVTADFTNVATVTGKPPVGADVTDRDDAVVDAIHPAIAVIKSGPATSFRGDTAVFTFLVTNAGDTPLSGVTVHDDVCGPATYLLGDANDDAKLDLGETWVFRCSYVVKPGDPDPLVNIVTATGADELGQPVSDQDTWSTDLFTVRFGDFVWVDDGDGVQQPGETTGIANVPIHVTGLDVLGHTIDITVTTSITGFYMVSNLIPGVYTATVPSVVGTYHLSSPGTLTFTLSQAVQQRLDIDFGYTLPTGVLLLAFDAVPDATTVQLSWEMMLGGGVTEPPRFQVWRSDAGGAWKQLTTDYLAPSAHDGVRASYAYTDVQVERGKTYLYQLRSADGETYGPRQVTMPAGYRKVYLPLVVR